MGPLHTKLMELSLKSLDELLYTLQIKDWIPNPKVALKNEASGGK